MAIEIMNPISWTVEDWKQYLIPFYNAYLSQYSDSSPISEIPVTIDYYDNTTDGDNFSTTFCYVNNWRHNYIQSNRLTSAFMKWSVNLTKTGGNHCLVRVPIVKEGMAEPIIYSYFLVGSTNGITCDYHGKTSITSNYQEVEYVVGTGAVKKVNNASTGNLSIDNRDIYSTVANTNNVNAVVNRINTTTEIKEYIRAIFTYGVENTPYHVPNIGSANIYAYGTNNGFTQNYNSPIMGVDSVPDWMPLYYLNNSGDVTRIINYLETGDDSERDDPFDPNTPKQKFVENFKTNFRVFVTPDTDDKARTKFSVIGYNTDYINGGETMKGLYKMPVEESTDLGAFHLIQNGTQASYPTVGFKHTIEANKPYEFRVYFGDIEDATKRSGRFLMRLLYDKENANHFKIDLVTCNVPDEFSNKTVRSAVTDGYRYTSTVSGEWIEVLYRSPGIDDLIGYDNEDDNEDDSHGTDSTFVVGNGLNTFAIDGTKFGQINKKLWSTDWTQVFKSNSIDPIRCVISCKGIPFTATPGALADVVIANMDTGVDANTCNPVKSFDCGSVLMPSYRGDFSDITHTQVHLYLPFIGWCELPGAEVISRKAYGDVGISANPKRLGFKYIVDFVDGSCRCIVTVNGTERWYFDGHCDVDIPVTSDNHTQAVGNAIRSGVGAVLSVASAVGGAFAENPMMIATGVTGAISNGANTIPTYSYSATSSPSGYINASMNNHIMIVIEHPNMIVAHDYNHKYGRPCGLTCSLGSLRGFTKCGNVDTSGINGTETELSMIKSMLESGVYL